MISSNFKIIRDTTYLSNNIAYELPLRIGGEKSGDAAGVTFVMDQSADLFTKNKYKK